MVEGTIEKCERYIPDTLRNCDGDIFPKIIYYWELYLPFQ